MKNLSLLFILFLVINIPVYSQNTINIPADYPTIQEGINAAGNGDLVLVADGLYYENINFIGKAITVASHFIQDGNLTHIENTIIDGSHSSEPDTGSTVIFNSEEDASSVLCGFTITGGTGCLDSYWGDRSGGGIYLGGSSATIKNNIIEYNIITHDSYTNGGGIVIMNSDSIIIENNVVRNNTITGNEWSSGGGIAIYQYSEVQYVNVANNKIIDNTASDPNFASGAGIEINSFGVSNRINIISNYIKGNNCTDGETYGGGLDFYICSPTVKNNLIIENSAGYGGGVFMDALTGKSEKPKQINDRRFTSRNNRMNYNKLNSSENSLVSVFENNTIVNNSAAVEGGGVGVNNSLPQFMNFIVWGNTSPSTPQISGTATVQYSDVEGGYSGTGNIDSDPLFADLEYYLLGPASPCIDAGHPDPQYNDVEDPLNPGIPLHPAFGTLRNDMGHCGGPNSLWCYWDWPIPVELTSFTATLNSNGVILNWSTATEINNEGFDIERSKDKVSFDKIGFVPGFGTSTEPKNYSYSDQPVNAGMYYYRLKQIDYNGISTYSHVVEIEWRTLNSYLLEQNYPNPFNPTTTIGYSIQKKSNVKIIILNAIGEEVAVVLNEEKEAGYHQVEINASNLSSGIYFYKLQAGTFIQTKKMMLLK